MQEGNDLKKVQCPLPTQKKMEQNRIRYEERACKHHYNIKWLHQVVEQLSGS